VDIAVHGELAAIGVPEGLAIADVRPVFGKEAE
jgi:hypothetical protein